MPIQRRLPQHPLITSTLLLFVHTMVYGQGAVQWVTVGGTSQLDSPRQLAFGRAGEIYLPGTFGYDGSGTLSFEAVLYTYDLNGLQTRSQAWRGEEIDDLVMHTNGNYSVTGRVIDSDLLGVGLSQDFYLAAYAADGTLIWERTAGTTAADRTYQKDGQPGLKLALDNGGNIYVAGRSIGPAIFGSSTFPNTPGGPLICKYSQDGTLLWAKRAEGRSLAPYGVELGGGAANGIVLDTNGNALVSGYMTKGEANFDGIVINISGRYDTGAFIAKYSPAGQILWAQAVSGETVMDGQGNVLIDGLMTNALANIGGASISIPDPSAYNSFVAMLSPAGSLLWAKATTVGGLAVDTQGNIYSGASKFDSAGNLIWVRKIAGASLTLAALNNREEPVFTGTIVGTVNFDGHTVRSDGDNYTDYVICKADRNGTFQWAVSVNSGNLAPGFDEGPVRGFGRVGCDQRGNVFAFGTVNCPWSFPQQTRDCSVAKFGDIPLSVQYGGNNDFFLACISDPAPLELKIKSGASGLVLSWPAYATGFVLESSTTFPASSWTPVNTAPVVQGNENVVSVNIEPGARFFRLRKS